MIGREIDRRGPATGLTFFCTVPMFARERNIDSPWSAVTNRKMVRHMNRNDHDEDHDCLARCHHRFLPGLCTERYHFHRKGGVEDDLEPWGEVQGRRICPRGVLG